MLRRWLPWLQSSGPTARWWTLGGAIVLAGFLAYALRGLVAWALNLLVRVGWFFDSLPQDVVWLLLLVALAYLTLRLAGRAQPRREVRTPATDSTTSDLAELVQLVRRAEVSSLARWQLGQRLAQAAVALRVRREAITPRQAWDALADGRWPTKPELQAVLRPGRGWRRPMRIANYPRQLRATVDALWDYAKGGNLDGN